ncbi:hypothetical protein GCM10008015_18680 [Flavobacterium palustre]|uniref:DUF3347 domain-containing protein n=2 Tax=Flavobacterium palustre TaxID=1476463 RepID=A0ABQ1HHQ1_9FLAO|nr:hypothetical protein GCM10008015_18680 [Flavobacterium palustre]
MQPINFNNSKILKMKKIILSSLLLAVVCFSCNQKNKEEEKSKTVVETAKAEEAAAIEEITEVSDVVKASVSTEAIIDSYLEIKNALANDNSAEAATMAADFSKAVEATKTDKIAVELKDKYSEATEEAKKQAALIVSNSGKIDQQRKSFAVLSKNITSLIATFGTNKKLFQDYCPMYDEGKSGYWISEMKAIRNPYYGSEMLECGGMIKEIK